MDMPEMDNELNFPINQELVESATQSMEEWRIVKDRLQKIDDHKDGVSEKVYERVRQDYEARLSEATDKLLSKKTDVDNELAALGKTRDSIEQQLAEHRHKLEEINFRNTLGEFTESEFVECSKVEQEKISKFETVINAVDNNITRYEAIFEGENDLFAKQEEPSPEEDISEVADTAEFTPAPHQPEASADDAGYGLDSDDADYFSSPETDEHDSTEEHIKEDTSSNIDKTPVEEDSNTKKAPIDVNIEASSEMRPRVVVISGDNAGAAYPLKSTTSFGRAETSTVPLNDAKCSRQHAQIQQHGNEYMIIDLNSSNGTYINGENVEEHVLSNDDEILIGDTLLQFQIDS